MEGERGREDDGVVVGLVERVDRRRSVGGSRGVGRGGGGGIECVDSGMLGRRRDDQGMSHDGMGDCPEPGRCVTEYECGVWMMWMTGHCQRTIISSLL